MRSKLSIFRNIVLPVMILLPLIGIMVGCIYIPTFKCTDDCGTKQSLLLAMETQKQITLGKTTRSQIEALLGNAPIESTNGRVAVYFNITSQGVWIEPLCAYALWADRRLYALELKYDEHFVVASVKLVCRPCAKPARGVEFIDYDQSGYVLFAKERALDELNELNGFSTKEGFLDRRKVPASDFYLDPSLLRK